MKKASLFILIFTLMVGTGWAQKKYDRLWKKVEQDEVNGLGQQVLKRVEDIHKKARKDKNDRQLVKAFIYTAKYELILKKDIENEVYQEFLTEIDKAQTPVKQILASVMANSLYSYQVANRYRIQGRLETSDNFRKEDFTTWTANDFEREIMRLYRISMENPDQLLKLKDKEYNYLLTYGGNYDQFQSSLYDLLARRYHDYLNDFYQTQKFYGKSGTLFKLDNPQYFGLSDVFTRLSLEPEEEFPAKNLLILKYYQDVEKIYLKSNDQLTLLTYSLERLKMLVNQSKLENKDEIYKEALKKFGEYFKGEEEQAWISYSLAEFYYERADKIKHPDYYLKSLEEIEKVLQLKKQAYVVALALNLKKNILKTEIKVTTEEILIPNKIQKALVNFRNTDSLYLRVYSEVKDVSAEEFYATDSIWKFLYPDLVDLKKAYKLPKRETHFDYSTEILLPELAPGRYILIFSPRENPDFNKDIFGWSYVEVSNLAYIRSSYDRKVQFLVTDRINGAPVPGAKLELIAEEKESSKKISLTTDENGKAEFKGRNGTNARLKGYIAKDQDTLMFSFREYFRRKNTDNDRDIRMNAFLLADRRIYRPGQKLYFKGFVAFEKKKERQVVEDFEVEVTLYDSNYEQIKSMLLTTNEFGTVQGEFEIPKNRSTGEFYIEINENYKEGKWREYLIDFKNYRNYFFVEEYKRPTFEVTFDDLEQTYFPGDSILLKGNAKAFFGGNLSNVSVEYTIDSSADYNWWERDYYIYNPNNSDRRLKVEKIKTDTEGNFEIPFKAEIDSLISAESARSFTYSIIASVTDINGETRTAEKEIKVSYKPVNVVLNTPSKVELGEEKTISLSFTDLNGVKVEGEGSLRIYQYEIPDRVFKKRPWNRPEIQEIPEEQFRALFPYERYDSLDLKEHWKKTLVHTIPVPKGSEHIFDYDKIHVLTTGEYFLEFEGTALGDYKIQADSEIDIVKPETPSKPMTNFLESHFEIKRNEDGKLWLFCEFDAGVEGINLLFEMGINGFNGNDLLLPLRKGHNLIPINLPDESIDVNLQYAFIRDNTFERKEQKVIVPKPEEEKLSFEIVHFRDKLQPGNRETWEFKVLNPDKTFAEVEVLASMYDASLDDFVRFDWNLNLYQGPRTHPYYVRGISSMRISDFGKSSFYGFNITSVQPYKIDIKKTDLKMFGYDFTNPSRVNQKYLEELAVKYTADIKKSHVLSGTVTDEDGMPLFGVMVMADGSSSGTQTDFDGNYYLRMNPGETIRFTLIGYSDYRIKANPGVLNVTLKQGEALDMILTGYQTGPERKYTKAATTTEAEMLSGKVSGLNIARGNVYKLDIGNNSGEPGTSGQILLRGVGTLQNEKTPLFVLDGKIVTRDELDKLSASALAQIAVLKGPEAVALYGNQAANGVIVITSKQALEELDQIKPRENLRETAFFLPDLKTDKEGNIRFTFDSPEALTRWKFQAFAHDKSLRQAYLQLNSVTQKDLNIIPNFPRFFRAGDTLTISAKINNLSDKNLQGLARLKFTDEITQKEITLTPGGALGRNFNITAKGNSEVNWEVIIPEGVSAVRYEISAKAGNFTDGEASVIPVLSNRIFVTESVPLWVNPKEEKTFVLDNLKANNSSTLENHKLILDYTSRPVWTALQALPYLIEYPYECSEQIFARYYGNTLTERILKSNPDIADLVKSWENAEGDINEWERNAELKNILLEESPWLKTAGSQIEQQKRLAGLFNSKETLEKRKEELERLSNIQSVSGGFPWFSGGRENLAISTHILIGMGRLGAPDNDELREKYDEITDRLISYLDNHYLNTYLVEKDGKIKYNFNAGSLYYLYARSFFEKENERLSDYEKHAMNILSEEWVTQPIFHKVILALTAQKLDRKQLSKDILKSLKDNMVINSEEGMYWKENTLRRGWYEGQILVQSLAIEAFAESGADSKTLNGLKTWLLRQKQTQSWSSTRTTTDAIYALLFKGEDLWNEESVPEMTLGKEKLTFDSPEGKAGLLKAEFEVNEIKPDMATLKIKNKGVSPQFGGLYWQYFEESDKVLSSGSSDLQIEKEIYIVEETDTGKKLIPIAEKTPVVGDLLNFRFIIYAKADFEFMHLKDMRAAGLEPVDVISEYKYKDGLAFYQSTRDIATHFFFDRMPIGTYVIDYEVRVNNSGVFSNGISRLQSMYSPEFTTQTEGRRVEFKRD